jgi:hypothetical protein
MIGLGLGLGLLVRRAPDLVEQVLSLLSPSAAQLLVHPIREGYLFQDRAGTTPVTADGQVVGLILDAGPLGRHLTAISDPARGVFRRVGQFRWIEFNGTNTSYSTAALPAPGVDKVQVFAAVRKASDAVTGVLAEISTNRFASGNAFTLFVPDPVNSRRYSFVSRGTDDSAAFTMSAAFNAPHKAVLTALGDISGDRATLLINGTQVAQSTTDQGTGNFNPAGAHPLFVGARGGSSIFFNANLYGALITRFSAANLSTETVSAVNAILAPEIAGAP